MTIDELKQQVNTAQAKLGALKAESASIEMTLEIGFDDTLFSYLCNLEEQIEEKAAELHTLEVELDDAIRLDPEFIWAQHTLAIINEKIDAIERK